MKNRNKTFWNHTTDFKTNEILYMVDFHKKIYRAVGVSLINIKN